nr:hypothetical protein [Tanacetum cinerariifolium]
MFENVKRLRFELVVAQSLLCVDPHNGLLREAEAKTFKAYKSLGMKSVVSPIVDPGSLFFKSLPEFEALYMIRVVSDNEIKKALFSIDGNKASGPDDFFRNGKLLKEVNATVISLVPKTDAPLKVSDYRLIRGCNVVYKIISKIISSRLKLVSLVNDNQCAFIPSRQISDNILLSQELIDSKFAVVLKLVLDEFGDAGPSLASIITHLMPIAKRKSSKSCIGVPLISKRIYVKDCQLLIDRVKKRVFDWKNKALSFAGRRQLMILKRLMRDFIWKFEEFKRGISKVNWDAVSKPKLEGGLGIKSLNSWNIALIREILSSGLSLNCKVIEIIKDEMWDWPAMLTNKYDGLSVIPPPCFIMGKYDKVGWRNNMGRHKEFFVLEVWNDIGNKSELVSWSRLVWFSQCIPRRSFMLWLAILRRLKTHDLMDK